MIRSLRFRILHHDEIEKLIVLMTSNDISDVGAKKIISAVAKCPNLTTLNILCMKERCKNHSDECSLLKMFRK